MKLFQPILFLAFNIVCHGQDLPIRQNEYLTEKYARGHMKQKLRQNVRIVFYNVENLYDPFNDTLKLDDEYTAHGIRHWTYSRFREKLNHVAKTFIAMGSDEPPAIIGMCEVENQYVLKKLVEESPLKRFRYRIIHHESPDNRGVDVALLYRHDRFVQIDCKTFPVHFPFDTAAQTREILLVKGTLFQSDTINLLINHWPSRRGGYEESQPKRNYVASLVKSICDSVFMKEPVSRIVLMGDLNDEPDKESLTLFLGTKQDTMNIKPTDLVNLMYPKIKYWNEGTIKYQGQWSVFDQFIVSGNLVSCSNGIHTSFNDAHIFTSTFLTLPDDKAFGVKLNRTYTGPKYTGGFSDHLPIYLDIWKTEEVFGSLGH